MKSIIFILFFAMVDVKAEEDLKKVPDGVLYLSTMFANLHQSASRYSSVLTTIQCGHPLKVFKQISKDGKEFVASGIKWKLVSAGPYEGYVALDLLTSSKPNCFQDQYSKFFDEQNLDISDMYYWARLNDQYVSGETKVKK